MMVAAVAGAVALVASPGAARAESGVAQIGAANAQAEAAPIATLTVMVKGKETFQLVSALSAQPTLVFDQHRLTSVTVTAKAGEPHLGLWVGVRNDRARAKEKLRGSLVFDRQGGENVTGSVSGRWHADTSTFEGTWHGKQITRHGGKKKTLVLSGTLRLLLPVGSPAPVIAS